jgi:hypothetical protein
LRSIHVPEDPVQVEFCPSWNSEYKWPTICGYRKKVQLKSRLEHKEISSPPVIAQHYSSATFVSMHFTSRDEQYGARFKSFIISYFRLEKLSKFEIS